MTDARMHRHAGMIAEVMAHLGSIPEHLRGGLERYFTIGMQPGQFLCAVLDNNLREAVNRCTGDLQEIRAVLIVLYSHAPAPSWGDRAKRLEWQRRVGELTKGEGVSSGARAHGGDGA